MCHDCIEGEKIKKKGKGADNSSSPSIDQCDTIELQVHLMYPLILPRQMKPAYDNSSMSFHLFRSKDIFLVYSYYYYYYYYKLQTTTKAVAYKSKFSRQNYK